MQCRQASPYAMRTRYHRKSSESGRCFTATESSNPFRSTSESAANSDNRLHSGDTGDKIRGATLVDQRTDPALGGAGISQIDEMALGKYVAELARTGDTG